MAASYPQRVTAAWIGNTARIAEKHYLQVPPEYFRQGSENPADSKGAAQYPAVQGSKGQKGTRDKGSENGFCRLVPVLTTPYVNT